VTFLVFVVLLPMLSYKARASWTRMGVALAATIYLCAAPHCTRERERCKQLAGFRPALVLSLLEI
jgi:hypothetical protein